MPFYDICEWWKLTRGRSTPLAGMGHYSDGPMYASLAFLTKEGQYILKTMMQICSGE